MVIFDSGQKKIIKEGNCINYYSEGVLFSKIYLDEPLKYSFYLISTVLGLLNNTRKVLILGTGLGTAIRQFKELLPDAEITSVDIDEEVFFLGKKYFGLSRYQDIEYVLADAIEYVKQDNNYYDYVMVDLYDGTKLLKDFIKVDFLHSLYCRLNKGGILAFNSSMRDFNFLESLCNNNPLQYIYQNMFLAGFTKVTKLDFNYSGWVYCFKIDNLSLLCESDNIQSNSKYVKTALRVQRFFSHKIANSIVSDKILESDELMVAYRDYLLNLIINIRRGNIPTLSVEEGKEKIIKLFLDYTRKKISMLGPGSVIKNMFVCNDITYFKELDILLREYHYSLEDVANIVMLPERNLLKIIDDVMTDNKFKIYGYYQYDTVSVDENDSEERIDL